MTETENHSAQHDSTVIGTIQSLIVALVLAMTFRGFVSEGFVIPTGSMAPTLLGEHVMLHSEQTGWDFPVGFDSRVRQMPLQIVADPMLGPDYPGTGTTRQRARTRMGDRILVLKTIYPFAMPNRFDVVVFKNPTNPNGKDGNFIKRLVGLPDESILLLDGDVFAGSADRPGDFDSYQIQRKPEHIQRTVWQAVHRSGYLPVNPDKMDQRYQGAPWRGKGWNTEDRRSYRCDTGEPTVLAWDNYARELDDWAPYNMLTPAARHRPFCTHDLRVAATVVPDRDGLEITLRLESRSTEYEFIINGSQAFLRMRPGGEAGAWEGPPDPFDINELHAGEPTEIEFWHVDQSMSIYINGKRIARYEYDWRPLERLTNAAERDGDISELAALTPSNPTGVQWEFKGSPVTLHRVPRVRDTRTMEQLLAHNGANVDASEAGRVVVEASDIATPEAPYEVVKTMRAWSASDQSPCLRTGTAWRAHPPGARLY